MFFCDKCAKESKWPISTSQSYGYCEICGNVADCSDVRSGLLPDPEPRINLPISSHSRTLLNDLKKLRNKKMKDKHFSVLLAELDDFITKNDWPEKS